ncbi:MAG: CPBP family intramembrane metalloprotease [Oscillospiraceae bacterium]|nr:CPBP family intramembrane metalloprotease [Oscillospiraceae bacterium]
MKILKFLIITFAISWSCLGLLVVLNNIGVITYTAGLPLIMIGAFGPGIAAILLQKDRSPSAIVRFIFSGDYKPWPYLLLFGALLGAAFWFPTQELTPHGPPLLAFPIVLLVQTLFTGGQEELGWQGFLRPSLEQHMPFPLAVVLLGVIWAVWHLPLWLIAGSPQENIHFGVYAVMVLVFSFPLSVLHKKTNSVFLCCLLHGLVNTLSAYLAFGAQWALILNGSVVNRGVIVGAIVVVAVSLLVWQLDKSNIQIKECVA